MRMDTKMKIKLLFIFCLFYSFVHGQIDAEFEPINVSKETKETVYVKYKRFEKRKLFYVKYYNPKGKVMRFEQFLQRSDTPENVTIFSFNSFELVKKLKYFYYNNEYLLMDSFSYTYNDTKLVTIRHFSRYKLKAKLTNTFQDSLIISQYWYYFNDTTEIQMNFYRISNKYSKPKQDIREKDTTFYFYDSFERDSFQYQMCKTDTLETRLFTYKKDKINETRIAKTFPHSTSTTIITFNSSGQKIGELCRFKYTNVGYRNKYKYNKQGLLIKETNRNWSSKHKEHNFKWTYYHSYE